MNNKVSVLIEKNKLISEINNLLKSASKDESIALLNNLHEEANNIKTNQELKKVEYKLKKYQIINKLNQKLLLIESKKNIFSNNQLELPQKNIKEILDYLNILTNKITELMKQLKENNKFDSNFGIELLKGIDKKLLELNKIEMIAKINNKINTIQQASLYFSEINIYYQQLIVTKKNIKEANSIEELSQLQNAVIDIIKSINEQTTKEKINFQERINQLDIPLQEKNNLLKELEKVDSLKTLVELESKLQSYQTQDNYKKIMEEYNKNSEQRLQQIMDFEQMHNNFHEGLQDEFNNLTPYVTKALEEYNQMLEEERRSHPKR